MSAELPLHPALVHIPLGIAFVMPLLTGLFLVLFQLKVVKRPAIYAITLLHLILSISSFVAVETGEKEEHRVEKVVAEKHIEEHEERAEGFARLSIVALLLSVAVVLVKKEQLTGLLTVVLFVSQLVLVYIGYQVGHSGGELVYKHGAAGAYTHPPLTQKSLKDDHDDDDDDDD